MSHVLIDGFTHGNKAGWATAIFPVLRTPLPTPFGPVPLHDVLQSLTIIFGLMALQFYGPLAVAALDRLRTRRRAADFGVLEVNEA
jgi:hypothetical protein